MQRNTSLKSVFCYSLTIGTTNQVPRRMNCHILTLNAAATIKNISFQFSVVSDNSDRTFSNRGRHPLENFQNKIWSHNSRAPALFDLVNLATVLAGDTRGRFSKQQKSCWIASQREQWNRIYHQLETIQKNWKEGDKNSFNCHSEPDLWKLSEFISDDVSDNGGTDLKSRVQVFQRTAFVDKSPYVEYSWYFSRPTCCMCEQIQLCVRYIR